MDGETSAHYVGDAALVRWKIPYLWGIIRCAKLIQEMGYALRYPWS